MAEFTEITLTQDSRWDTISNQAYGSVNHVPEIADANPSVPLTEFVPAGTKLYIPIIEQAAIETNNLPPWKR